MGDYCEDMRGLLWIGAGLLEIASERRGLYCRCICQVEPGGYTKESWGWDEGREMQVEFKPILISLSTKTGAIASRGATVQLRSVQLRS